MKAGIKKYFLKSKDDRQLYFKSSCEDKISIKRVGVSDWYKGFDTHDEAIEFINKNKLNDMFDIKEIELKYFL